MPELRQNMVTKEWVIIATERAKRPDDFVHDEAALDPANAEPSYAPNCPFCPGNEEIDLEVDRLPDNGIWQVRVVQNKYPALMREEQVERSFEGVQRWITGAGHHEVVVDHPSHNLTWALMTPAEIQAVLEMFYQRGWGLRDDHRIEQIVYFKNHKERAGASLRHPHCQIIGLPIVPTHIRRRIDEARRYFDDRGECVFQAMLRDELKAKKRIIQANEDFVAFILYAASSPFHIWIIPRRQSVSFAYIYPTELQSLAEILHDLTRRLYIGLNDPAYNLIIRSSPVKEIANEYLQWYITLIPRMAHTAGFELGSGMYINPALPEESAAFLRGVQV